MLPVRVEVRESPNRVWRELTRLEKVSDCDAEFHLTRLLEIGQIVSLTMPLGKDLRRYDCDEEQYTVWAVVRHCLRSLGSQAPVHLIEASFVGREPPAGYRRNPLAGYRLGELQENGFYAVIENAQPTSRRRQQRYAIPIEIYIAVYDAEDNILAHERTVTENISESGASVFSALQINVGDTIRIIKQHGSFSADAVVRARRVGKDNLPRLHLEFINARFPLDGIG